MKTTCTRLGVGRSIPFALHPRNVTKSRKACRLCRSTLDATRKM